MGAGILTSDVINIPDYMATDDSEQVVQWRKIWNERYEDLGKVIKSLPDYSENDNGMVDVSINVEKLEEFDSKKLNDSLVILQRNYLAGINEMERAYNLLFSRFNILAIFSLIFAVFLDVSSFLAGLFIYVVDEKKTNINT